jgi:hypothetical protein
MREQTMAQTRSASRIGPEAVWVGLGVCSGLGMALAAWLLIAPNVGPPPAFPYQDKVFHFVAFGCLTGPAALVLPRRYLGFWLGHMMALGAGVEVVQELAGDGRSGSVWDFLADAAGVIAAVALARLIRSRLEARD